MPVPACVSILHTIPVSLQRKSLVLSSNTCDQPRWRCQVDAGKLRAYYEDAYAAIRAHAPACFVAISPRNWEQDGFEWQTYMAAPPYTKVLQDLHRCASTSAGPSLSVAHVV